MRDWVPDPDPEDVMLIDDLLGIADHDVALPEIDPDARRRRLTGNRLQPGGRHQEPNRDGKSRTLVLTATMRSPTIGSPDQTQKRAHCAKKHRPRRATAPDFPACAGVPEGDQETQNFVSEMAPR
jgi:hypothetical protein